MEKINDKYVWLIHKQIRNDEKISALRICKKDINNEEWEKEALDKLKEYFNHYHATDRDTINIYNDDKIFNSIDEYDIYDKNLGKVFVWFCIKNGKYDIITLVVGDSFSLSYIEIKK